MKEFERMTTAAMDLKREGGEPFESLGDLISFVLKLVTDKGFTKSFADNSRQPPPHCWWFRGEADSGFDLNARLFRLDVHDHHFPDDDKDYFRLEQKIAHKYAMLTRGRFKELSENPWDRLFEMQHYGMPTRLLDWTLNLGSALWFALHGADRRSQDRVGRSRRTQPVLWVLQPRLLSKAALGEMALNDYAYLERHGTSQEVSKWDPPRPPLRSARKLDGVRAQPGLLLNYLADHRSRGHFPVLQSWTNPRLSAQMGCFTLQSGGMRWKPRSLVEYQESLGKSGPRFLFKLRLDFDRGELEGARKELASIGVSEYTLYPELERSCEWIKRQYNLYPKPAK